MYPTSLKPLLLAALFISGTATAAGSDDSAVLWEREAALSAVTASDSKAMSRELLALTIAGAGPDLLDMLEATRTRADWPAPARDAAVFSFVESLRELPPGAIDRDIMTYLKAFQVNTLITHEDHPYSLVPLFNVRSAAHGVENDWKREEALLEGMALLRSNPHSLADAFALEYDNAVRAGYRQALGQAQPAALAALNQAAAMRLAESPELTALFAGAASSSGNLDAHRVVIQSGRGAPVADMLREFSAQADLAAQRQLLLEALAGEQGINAPLVVAGLAPALLGDAQVDRALIEALNTPALGAGAALVLSRATAPETLAALETLARSGSGAAAARARLALDLRQELAAAGRS